MPFRKQDDVRASLAPKVRFPHFVGAALAVVAPPMITLDAEYDWVGNRALL